MHSSEMGTGTTGARAINLARRALEEDECLSRERGEYAAKVRGGVKVKGSKVGGEVRSSMVAVE